jgi:hypothetical protein
MRRSLRSATGAACAVLAAGCYTLQPAATAPAPDPGAQVAFDVSDAGRLALGGSIGPAIARIEGRLVRRDGDENVVAVTGVNFLGGGAQVWSGEPVRLRPEHVATTYRRRLSKTRTIAVAAVGLGALAFLVTRSVVGGGDGDPAGPEPPVGTSFRPARR